MSDFFRISKPTQWYLTLHLLFERDIHWRKSARIGRLMIRQHEENVGKRIAIFFDNYQKQANPSHEQLHRQEQAISHAASLAAHYVKLGYLVKLVTRSISVGLGSGPNHLSQLLKALALLEFIDQKTPFVGSAKWSGECIYVDTSAPQKETP